MGFLLIHKWLSSITPSETLQKLAANTSWLFADRIVRLGLGLFLNIWLARYLGPNQYGLLNYATAFVTLFSVFVTLGFDTVVVRDLVNTPKQKTVILGSVFLLRGLGAALSVLLITASFALTHPHEPQVFRLVAIIALGNVFQIFDTIDLWFQARLQSHFTVYAKNGAFLLLTIVKVILIKLQAPLSAFAWAATAEIAVGALGLLMVYQWTESNLLSWRLQAAEAMHLIKKSWPLFLHGLAVFVQARVDQVLLGDLVNEAEVGQYAVALRLVEVLGFLPVIIQISAAPLATRAKAFSADLYNDLFLNLYRLMFLLFLVTAIPLCLFSTWLVVQLFGQQYAAASTLLPWFAPRIFFTNFGVAKHLFIVNDDLLRYSLFTAIAGAIINLVFNYWLIPRYASFGAILAMSISFLVNLFLLDLFYAETRPNLRLMLKGIFTAWRLRIPAIARHH